MKLKSNIYAFIFIGLVAAVVACGHRAPDTRLTQAERLMEEHPDSALEILEAIPADSLRSRADRAAYALLYTQALDKNHLDPTDDSLMTVALTYYEDCGDRARLTLCHHYQGRVRQHNCNYPQALVSFFKAKQMAEEDGDMFRAGMACRGISDIYMECFNAADELTFARKEYEYIRKSGRQPYLNYSLNDLGRAVYNNRNFDEAIRISEQLLDSAVKSDDYYLYNEALRLKGLSLTSQGKYRNAYPVFTEICNSEFAQVRDSLELSQVLVNIGQVDESMYLLDRISDSYSLPFKNIIRYQIYISLGQYKKAIPELSYTYNINDSIFRASISQNLAAPITDYFEAERKLTESRLRNSRITLWLIILSCIIIFGICGYVGFYLYRRQKRLIEEKVRFASQLQEELSQSREDNTNSVSVIKSLMSTKYELLEQLCGIVLTSNDTKTARRKIADTVTKLIDDLSIQSEKITELENYVDSLYGNIFTDFRNDLPSLKEADYRLYLFSVLRLSNTTISFLLKEEKLTAVYDRKKRLKIKIRRLEENKAQRYMSYFI
ncbi:MAG: hypothetical protein K2H47_06620 [Muribaculaceae bacterium]|nr:hypothetical protein [Muribaculaceae bacterium]